MKHAFVHNRERRPTRERKENERDEGGDGRRVVKRERGRDRQGGRKREGEIEGRRGKRK